MDRELTELKQTELSICKKVDLIKITSTESLKEAVEITAEIKEAKKRVEEIRKFFVDPLNKQVKDINAKFKPHSEMFDKAEVVAKNKIVIYQTEQEKIRVAEEERLRKLQEKEYAKQIAKAEKKGDDIPPPPPPVKIGAEKVEGLSMREIWDFEIVDISKIPLEYMCPDEKKIRKVISAGVQIAGIRSFKKTISAISSIGDEL